MSFFVFVPLWFLLHLCLLPPFSLNIISFYDGIQTTCYWQRKGDKGVLENRLPSPTHKLHFEVVGNICDKADCLKNSGEKNIDEKMSQHWIGLAIPSSSTTFKIIIVLSILILPLNSNSVFEHYAKTIMSRGKSGLMFQWLLNTFEVKQEARFVFPFAH